MTSAPVRDPLSDHLLTPDNAAFLLIDYQPSQLAGIRSTDHNLLVKNAVSTVRTIKTFGVPVVHSTVNVTTGRGRPTVPELADLLDEDKPLDRTTVNSWEDLDFVQAVHATGRRKLIICTWPARTRSKPSSRSFSPTACSRRRKVSRRRAAGEAVGRPFLTAQCQAWLRPPVRPRHWTSARPARRARG